MLFNGGQDVTVKWPIEWRIEPGPQVLRGLEKEGLRVWPGGQVLVPSPFGLCAMKARLEVWQPGIVVRFRDGLPPAFVAWPSGSSPAGWRAGTVWEIPDVSGKGRGVMSNGADGTGVIPACLGEIAAPVNFVELLVRASHPRRFSPYHRPGAEWIFTGREAEMELLTSSLPGLQVTADFGMGKTTLLRRAASRLCSTVISCQGFGFPDLEIYVQKLFSSGGMPQVLFLDEMDALLRDRRTLALLFKLKHRGIFWRIAVHQPVPGAGSVLKLGSPRGMEKILAPLTSISGGMINREIERLLLQRAMGNPRRLMNLCKLVVDEMGQIFRPVDDILVANALLKLENEQRCVQRVI